MSVEQDFVMGLRTVVERDCPWFPESLKQVPKPPRVLYVLGDPSALREGLAVVGARKATPYGTGCARRFAAIAARKGVPILSGGARGCDAAAHEAALAEGGVTVAFLGGGCDRLYPPEHKDLFQRIVDGGGALVSEYPWAMPPLPYMFRERNRLIAGLAKATLIVEAGLPSGTFSTADEALSANRDVWAVPGAITARTSSGANRLIRQGAVPIVDDDSFEDELMATFGCLKTPPQRAPGGGTPSGFLSEEGRRLVALVQGQPMGLDALLDRGARLCPEGDARAWVFSQLAQAELAGVIRRFPDGTYGPDGQAA